MELLKTFNEKMKEKNYSSKKSNFERQAVERITVIDSGDTLYIAFDGVALFPIEQQWTTKDIIKQLLIFRQSYVANKLKSAVGYIENEK